MTTQSAQAPKKLRVFCGIDVPPDVLHVLQVNQRELKGALSESRISWAQLSEAHLTLMFFGDVDSAAVPRITEALASVCKESTPMTLSLAGRGCFPSEQNPRVLWMGVEDSVGQLAILEAQIRRTLGSFIVLPDLRAFNPHLTIARIRDLMGTGRDGLIKWLRGTTRDEPVSWHMTSVKLWSSQLSPAGAKHSVLAELPLACD